MASGPVIATRRRELLEVLVESRAQERRQGRGGARRGRGIRRDLRARLTTGRGEAGPDGGMQNRARSKVHSPGQLARGQRSAYTLILSSDIEKETRNAEISLGSG